MKKSKLTEEDIVKILKAKQKAINDKKIINKGL
jgi:hypothetical protein